MNRPMQTIEVDADTAASLEALAERRGVTLAVLLAEFAESAPALAESVEAQIAELDRRKAAMRSGDAIPHADVVRLA